MTTAPISHQDLPIWMRRALRPTDWGLLLCLTFGIVLALPMILQPSLPRFNDTEHYVFQTANIADSIREGRLYPRWSPHALTGYGAPIPHYYPPGAAYVSALVQIILTGDPVAAVKIVYSIALASSGVFVYLFTAARSGAFTGLIAGLLYTYSPYVGLVAPHILGDLPAVIGLLLLPWVLWSLDRLLVANDSLYVGMAGGGFALLVWTDPRMAAVGALLALGFTLWHTLLHDRNAPWLRALMTLGWGVLAAACFWLPAWLEHDAVTWYTLDSTTTRLLQPTDIFAALRPIDPASMRPAPQYTVGTPLALFSAAAAILFFGRRAWRSLHVFFLVLGSSFLIFAILFAPTATWLLGPITLCLAVGASGVARLNMRHRRVYMTLVMLIILAAALPIWFFPPAQDSFGSTSPAAQVAYEQEGFGIASLPSGLPLPTTISPSLQPNRSLLNSYNDGNITKIDLSNLNSNVQIGFLGHTTYSERLQVQTYSPTRFTLLTAYFPGWSVASSSPAPITIAPDPQTGLISIGFDRALATELTISLEPTPARLAAWSITWIACVALAISSRKRRGAPEHFFIDYALLSIGEVRIAIAVIIAAAAVSLGASNNMLDALRPQPNTELLESVPLRARTDSGLSTIAFRFENRHAYAPGDSIELTLYWRALRFLEQNYRVSIGLVDISTGQTVQNNPLRHPANVPTRRWLTRRHVADVHRLTIPTSLVPGDYAIQIEAFDCDPACSMSSRLRFFAEDGTLIGQRLLIPTVIRIAG